MSAFSDCCGAGIDFQNSTCRKCGEPCDNASQE